MNKYTILLWCWLGLALLPSFLVSQDNIRSLQQVQLLSQDECVVVQVNADWNFSANIDLSKLPNQSLRKTVKISDNDETLELRRGR